jgi:hypothetical protein
MISFTDLQTFLREIKNGRLAMRSTEETRKNHKRGSSATRAIFSSATAYAAGCAIAALNPLEKLLLEVF